MNKNVTSNPFSAGQNAVAMAARRILKTSIKELALIPEAAMKLVSLTRADNTRGKDLAKVIETEPVLAAKVIHVVNSAAYFLPNKISSISHAVSILGFSRIRQIAIDQLLYQQVMSGPKRASFDRLFFWQHCLFVASMSRAIAISLQHQDPDTVYTGGLLHDIGKIVFESHGRLRYSQFLEASERSSQFSLEAEADFFGLDHCAMGGYFAAEWRLPPAIVAMIAHHHQLPGGDSALHDFRLEAAIVSLSDYIAWIQGVGSDNYVCHPSLPDEVSVEIDVRRLDLDGLLRDVDQEMQKTQVFYDLKFPELATVRATLVRSALRLNVASPNASQNPPERAWSAALTMPHRSLDPKEFFPWTLSAVGKEFSLTRVLMLTIDPKQRGLKPSYWYPPELSAAERNTFHLAMARLTGSVLSCVRARQGILVTGDDRLDQPLLKALGVESFVVVPVLINNRLIGVLYADKVGFNQALPTWLPAALMPVAKELGIALGHVRVFREAKKQAERDPLTGLPNKRAVNDYLQQLIKAGNHRLSRAAVGFIDIDYFKQFNDRCGHQAGDDALRLVAEVLRGLTRPGDCIGRYGGEEFVFVLQDIDSAGARTYAERMREQIEAQGKVWSERFQGQSLTASLGLALYRPEFADYPAWVAAADQAMYQAKKTGRNRLVMY